MIKNNGLTYRVVGGVDCKGCCFRYLNGCKCPDDFGDEFCTEGLVYVLEKKEKTTSISD